MSGPFTFTIRDINTGNSIPGAKVQVLTDAVIVDTQISDAGGNVTITALNEGFYDVIVSKDGYLPTRLNREVLQNSFLHLGDLQLKPESNDSNLYGQNSGGTWEPLKTSSPGILTVNNITQSQSLMGCFYAIDTGSCSVPAGQCLLLQLTNPSGSAKRLDFQQVTGGSAAYMSGSNITLDVLKNASFPENGIALTPVNTNFGFADASLVLAKYVVRATPDVGGSLLLTYLIAGRSEKGDLGFVVMPPDSSMVIRLINTDNRENTCVITTCWSEEQI